MKREHFKVQIYDRYFNFGKGYWEDDVVFATLDAAKEFARSEARRTKESHRVLRVTEAVVKTFYKQKGAK